MKKETMIAKKKQNLSKENKLMAKVLLQALDRSYYLKSLGFSCFDWQIDVLRSPAKRKVINGARQSGKSTVVSAVPAHTARFYPGSISIIGAPTENQANETMNKVIAFISRDPDYPELKKCSTEEVELENGSRIIVRTAKSDTFRGYSCPRVIILDEASRIEEDAYTSGARPMLTDNPNGELYLISTPFGKEGFFYEAMNDTSGVWSRWNIRSPYTVVGTGTEAHLEEYMSSEEFESLGKNKGIKNYFSPRHRDLSFQSEQLTEMGIMQYRQEYETLFIEKQGQVFSYDEIQDMFVHSKEDLLTIERRALNTGGKSDSNPISFAV